MSMFTQEEAHRIREGLCWDCGHEDGEHDESCRKGGEDVLCRCESFMDSRGDPEILADFKRDGQETR